MPLQFADMKIGLRVKTKTLMASQPVFRDGMAFIRLKGSNPASLGVIFGFDHEHRKWICVEMGRNDYPNYKGLFNETEATTAPGT